MRRLAIIVPAVGLMFCFLSVLRHRVALEPVVASFHASYNRGQFGDIWRKAHPVKRSWFQSRDLQNAFRTEGDFESYLQLAQSRRGKMISSDRLSADHIDYLSWTEKLAVVQRTEFEKGVGTETFTYEIIFNDPVLVGYELR